MAVPSLLPEGTDGSSHTVSSTFKPASQVLLILPIPLTSATSQENSALKGSYVTYVWGQPFVPLPYNIIRGGTSHCTHNERKGGFIKVRVILPVRSPRPERNSGVLMPHSPAQTLGLHFGMM